MNKKLAFSLCLLASLTWSCSDDSSSGASGQDSESVACEPGCVNCVDGVCKDETGKPDDDTTKDDEKTCDPDCGSDQTCLDGVCVPSQKEPERACASCASDETCVDSACVKVEDACLKCGEFTKCVGGICYNVDGKSKCLNCDETQVCRDGVCYDATEFCATCAPDEKCVGGSSCEKVSDPCQACSAEQACVDGACVDCDGESCGGVCCAEGYGCDLYTRRCEYMVFGQHACNGIFCSEGYICDENGECARDCVDGRDACSGIICCDENTSCYEDMYCRPTCEGGSICGKADADNNYEGEFCCSSDQVCENDTCKIKCADNVVRCGDGEGVCCAEGQVCVFNKCLKPTSSNACSTDNDCDFWSTCDIASKSCVSADEDTSECIYNPPAGDFKPKIKWQYKVSGGNGVVQTPIVINLTDDNGDGKVNANDIPDVVFNDNAYTLTALSGDTGKILARTPTSGSRVTYNRHNELGAADIDNDGEIEVVTSATTNSMATSKLYAMVLRKNESGTYGWVKKYEIASTVPFGFANGGIGNTYWSDFHPSFADVDSDGVPEVITTRGIVKGNDWSKWKCEFKSIQVAAWYQSFFAVADLDEDGNMEIIDTDIYNNNCKVIVDHTNKGASFDKAGNQANEQYWYTAVADLIPDENDPNYPGELVPEIVRVRSGKVSVWKVYKTSSGWKQRRMWESNQTYPSGGGNPVIGDFDGDGDPDIGVAGIYSYSVFNGQDGTLVWTSKTQDESSNKTGSSVFDFEGDGIAEVIYRDEKKLRIYSGVPSTDKVTIQGNTFTAGRIIWETTNTSGTVIENPVIVDVDNDGRTEIVVVDEGQPSNGVTVYADTNDNWVRTRRIWNQHAYHVTNINEDGTVPVHEEPNWRNKHLNNYRMNVQPTKNFAPDFVPSDFKYTKNCDHLNDAGNKEPHITLTAVIKNDGSLGTSAELDVSFYIKNYVHTDGNTYNMYLGYGSITQSIAAGGTSEVNLDWNLTGTIKVGGAAVTITNIDLAKYEISYIVDDGGSNSEYIAFHECKEDNNESSSYKVEACSTIII